MSINSFIAAFFNQYDQKKIMKENKRLQLKEKM